MVQLYLHKIDHSKATNFIWVTWIRWNPLCYRIRWARMNRFGFCIHANRYIFNLPRHHKHSINNIWTYICIRHRWYPWTWPMLNLNSEELFITDREAQKILTVIGSLNSNEKERRRHYVFIYAIYALGISARTTFPKKRARIKYLGVRPEWSLLLVDSGYHVSSMNK